MLAFNATFRKLWAPRDLLVLMSDTGKEFPETYMHVASVRDFCDEQGIAFEFITKDLGFHNANWQSLEEYFERYDLIMSRVFNKSCTDNLKIQPLYRYLNVWLSYHFGIPKSGGKHRTKRALVEFAEKHGPVRMMLGIAKGEEGRVAPDEEAPHQWQRLAVQKAYPLLWLGWDRADCQSYIRKVGKVVPPPSNCMWCPFLSKAELLWLARKFPAEFERWCELEARKLQKFAHLGERNVCVLHKHKTLREVLADAERQYGDWTTEHLEEYRFSHGHCVRSRY